jgi:hypothetical protein
MLTVTITVNGKTVYARSAHRRTSRWNRGQESCYLTDAGDLVYHDPEKGIIKLAKKLLDSIKEI